VASPKVSIGVPVYNGERYLAEALESLVTQDFDDFEIIISDNASTDGTEAICRAYAARDARIRYVRGDSNIGSGPNYRRVFELARAPFFKWCAHDDVCKPGFLKRCYAVAAAAPPEVALVYPCCEFIDEHGGLVTLKCDDISTDARQPYRRLGRVIRRVSHGGPLWGLIRSDFLRRTQLNGVVSYWDDMLLAELAMLGTIVEVPELLFQVRCHQGNAVALISAEHGRSAADNPAKANKRARQALRAWTDPSRAGDAIWLPFHEEYCLEYVKRVRHAQLPPLQKALCYVTVPSVCYWGRLMKFGGLWRRKLAALFERSGMPAGQQKSIGS